MTDEAPHPDSDNCIEVRPRIRELDPSNITRGAKDLYNRLECSDDISSLVTWFYKPVEDKNNILYVIAWALLTVAVLYGWVQYYLASLPASAFGDVWVETFTRFTMPVIYRFYATSAVTAFLMYFLYTRSRPIHGNEKADTITLEAGSNGADDIQVMYGGSASPEDTLPVLTTWYGDGAGLHPAQRQLADLMSLPIRTFQEGDFLCVELRACPKAAGDILLPGETGTSYLRGQNDAALPSNKLIEALIRIPYHTGVQVLAVPRSDSHDRASSQIDRRKDTETTHHPTNTPRNSGPPQNAASNQYPGQTTDRDMRAADRDRVHRLETSETTEIFDVNVRAVIHVPEGVSHKEVKEKAKQAVKPFASCTNGRVTTTFAFQPVYNTPASSRLKRVVRAYKRWRSPDILTPMLERSLRFTPDKKYLRLYQPSSRANFAANTEEISRYLLLPGQPSTKARRGLDSDPKDQTPTGRRGPSQRDTYTTSDDALDPHDTDQQDSDRHHDDHR